jgi:putative acetyltransferase
MEDALDDSRFRLVPSGRFRERFGPLGGGAVHSSKKLCLVATDAALLVDTLYGISRRTDCYYVKYGLNARDGMFLGRCFLATDQATAELCAELKDHAQLLVTIQDDDWFASFRHTPTAGDSSGVWDNFPEHDEMVANVLTAAFGLPDQALAISWLRDTRPSKISLLAGVPPESGGDGEPWPIVGHILLTSAGVDGVAESRGLGLASLAVSPDHQRRGLGGNLVRAALRRATLLGYEYVVVEGIPGFFSRFGFAAGARFGLSSQSIHHASELMALELVPEALSGQSGNVHYRAPFPRPPNA